MSLEALKAFAVKNNFAAVAKVKSTPIYELSIEDARKKVTVRDGNRTPKADGSQALVLGFGRVTLSLDVIAPKATRVNASKEQVEEFTAILLAEVAAGKFDEAIQEAQLGLLETATKADPVDPVAVDGEQPVENPQEAVVGLDLSDIE